MRALLQRVQSARVEVAGQVIAAIDQGLLVLLAIEAGDTAQDQAWLVSKVAHQRLFADEQGKMNWDLARLGGSFLVVSQFTLLASSRKGSRPGFSRAAPPAQAEAMYQAFARDLAEASGCPVQCGRFAADMQVFLCNDGPVTLLIDSRLKE